MLIILISVLTVKCPVKFIWEFIPSVLCNAPHLSSGRGPRAVAIRLVLFKASLFPLMRNIRGLFHLQPSYARLFFRLSLGRYILILTNPNASPRIFQAKRHFLLEELLMKVLHVGIHEHNTKLAIVLEECP